MHHHVTYLSRQPQQFLGDSYFATHSNSDEYHNLQTKLTPKNGVEGTDLKNCHIGRSTCSFWETLSIKQIICMQLQTRLPPTDKPKLVKNEGQDQHDNGEDQASLA
jgi:hypothetical protein